MSRFNIKNFKMGRPLLLNMIGLALAAFLQSRAFMTGFLSAICFIWILKPPLIYQSKAKIRLMIIFIFVACIFLLACCFKQDSSAGRILVYKISWQMLKEHWTNGTGFGTFGNDYLNYQADYFAKGKYTVKELLLADNTKHAFNDYLQWVVETGIFGLLLLFIVLRQLACFLNKSLTMYTNASDWLIITISIIVNMLTAACFTHVFEIIYFQITFVICLSVVMHYVFRLRYTQLFFTSLVLSVIILVINYYSIVIGYRSYKKMDDAKILYCTGFIHKALENCEMIEPKLYGNEKFLSLYADILITSGYTNKAIYILKELLKKDNSYFFHTRLAECYQQIKELKYAEKEYIIAVNMVPNRFMSRYRLFLFYHNTNNKEKALKTASAILQLPVKVPSEEVKTIKASVLCELTIL